MTIAAILQLLFDMRHQQAYLLLFASSLDACYCIVRAFIQRIRGKFPFPLNATLTMSHWSTGEAVVSAHQGSSTQNLISLEGVLKFVQCVDGLID